MAKRFTATEKWLDPWFCNLSIVDRLFWIYLLDNCDHAGIWQVNCLLIETYFPGYELDPSKFGDRIRVLNPEKWFIPKFLAFQYGRLNPGSKPHASVIERLRKEGVSKGLAKGYPTLKDKDKDKDKAKAKAVEVGDFAALWARYPRKIGKEDAHDHFKAQVKTPQDWQDVQKALINFQNDLIQKGTEEKFIPHGSTWFNKRWRDWINFKPEASNGTYANRTGGAYIGAQAPAGKYAKIDENRSDAEVDQDAARRR